MSTNAIHFQIMQTSVTCGKSEGDLDILTKSLYVNLGDPALRELLWALTGGNLLPVLIFCQFSEA